MNLLSTGFFQWDLLGERNLMTFERWHPVDTPNDYREK